MQSSAGTELRKPSTRLLLLVVVSGAALRFYGLGIQSLWNDEIASWFQSHQPTLAAVIEEGVRPTTYPPAYQILLYYVERFVGESETALRFPSAVVGVLAILAMFHLGRRLYSVREGLIAATLTAFSYQPLYYSQEARAYSFLFLFAILSFNFWFQLLPRPDDSEPPSVRVQFGYAVTAIVTAYLHYFGLMLVALQLGGLGLLCLRDRRALVRAVILSIIVVAAYLPWLPYLFEEFERAQIHILEPTLQTAFGYWRFLFYNPGDHFKWFAAGLFAAAVIRTLGDRHGSDPKQPKAPLCTRTTTLLIAWLVLPFAIAYTRSKLSLPMITDRNLIISLPAALLLFSRALTRTVVDVRLQVVTVVTIVCILLYGLLVSGGYYRYPRKEQFREAVAVVVEREQEFPNARIIAHAWSKPIFDYYLERLGATARVDLRAGTAEDVVRLESFLAAENPDYVWFLLAHRPPEPAFMEALDRELELVFHVPLYKAFTRLYRRRGASD